MDQTPAHLAGAHRKAARAGEGGRPGEPRRRPIRGPGRLPAPEQVFDGQLEALLSELGASRRATEALDAIPPLLDNLRQSILAAAFRGDLTADWRAAHPDFEPASQVLERIRAERRRRWEEAELAKMNAKGKAPTDNRWKTKYQEPEASPPMPVDSNIAEGWVTAELEALCDPIRGIPYGIVLTGDHTEGGVPTVRCGDIKSFTVQLDRLKCVRREVAEQYERTRLRGGEVLLAIRGTVGATAVVPPAMAGMNISREVAMLTPLPGLNPKYLSYLIGNPRMQTALGAQVKGVAQAGINLADLRRLRIPLPPEREQAAIAAAIQAALDKVSAMEGAVLASLQNLPGTESGILGCRGSQRNALLHENRPDVRGGRALLRALGTGRPDVWPACSPL